MWPTHCLPPRTVVRPVVPISRSTRRLRASPAGRPRPSLVSARSKISLARARQALASNRSFGSGVTQRTTVCSAPLETPRETNAICSREPVHWVLPLSSVTLFPTFETRLSHGDIIAKVVQRLVASGQIKVRAHLWAGVATGRRPGTGPARHEWCACPGRPGLAL